MSVHAKVLDPAKRVARLSFRKNDAGASFCGECGAVISGDETGTQSLGLIDDLSSADARDWRTLGQRYVVFWPCGHHAIGGIVSMGTP